MENQKKFETHITISLKDFLHASIHKTREMQMRSLEKYLEKNNRIFTFEGNMCVVQVYDKQDAIRIGMENHLREVLYVEGAVQVKLQIVADPSSVKRTKIIVSDSNGNKTSLRKIKQQPRLEAKKNCLTKSDIIKRTLLTKKELDIAISTGQLTVTIIGKTGYIDRQELVRFITKKNTYNLFAK